MIKGPPIGLPARLRSVGGATPPGGSATAVVALVMGVVVGVRVVVGVVGVVVPLTAQHGKNELSLQCFCAFGRDNCTENREDR